MKKRLQIVSSYFQREIYICLFVGEKSSARMKSSLVLVPNIVS